MLLFFKIYLTVDTIFISEVIPCPVLFKIIIGRWEATGYHRSGGCPLQESFGHHNTSGDLISPGDSREVDAELWADNASTSAADNSNLNSRKVNLSSTLYHRMMAKKLMLNKQTNFNQSSDSNLVRENCSF